MTDIGGVFLAAVLGLGVGAVGWAAARFPLNTTSRHEARARIVLILAAGLVAAAFTLSGIQSLRPLNLLIEGAAAILTVIGMEVRYRRHVRELLEYLDDSQDDHESHP